MRKIFLIVLMTMMILSMVLSQFAQADATASSQLFYRCSGFIDFTLKSGMPSSLEYSMETIDTLRTLIQRAAHSDVEITPVYRQSPGRLRYEIATLNTSAEFGRKQLEAVNVNLINGVNGSGRILADDLNSNYTANSGCTAVRIVYP